MAQALTLSKIITIIENNGLHVLPKYGCKYTKWVDQSGARIVLYSSKYNPTIDYNGVVLSLLPRPEVIAYPAPSFKLGLPYDITGYNITEIFDGTVCTIYYWHGNWVMSTNKSPDATMLKQYGSNIRNIDAFEEALGEAKDEFYTMLDKKLSYTIGFHHKDIHPFQNNSYVWYIQATDKLGNKVVVDDLPIEYPRQYNLSIEELTVNINHAIDDYIINKNALIGYALENDQGNKYIINSLLMNYIKDTFYKSNITFKNIEDKRKYITLCKVITNDIYFTKIFTTLSDLYNSIKEQLTNLVDKIVTDSSNGIYDSPILKDMLIYHKKEEINHSIILHYVYNTDNAVLLCNNIM